MNFRADISLFVCCLFQVSFGQNFEALMSSLSGFSRGNDLFQGLGGAGMMGFGGAAPGGSSSCPYSPHPDRLKFTQRVNDQTFVRTCAPGTMYDAQTCGCVNMPKTASAGQRRGGSSIGPSSNNMAMINDLVKQMQNRAMGPPTQSRGPTPTAPRSQPVKPKSRSSTNPMDAIRQLASDTPQPFAPSGVSLDLFNVQPGGIANPISYNPEPNPTMTPVTDLSSLFLGNMKSSPMQDGVLSLFKNSACLNVTNPHSHQQSFLQM